MLTISPPSINDPDLQKIKDALGTTALPVLVKNFPEGTIKNNCFPAVIDQVKQHGGRMICGWAIWKAPVMIQAEAHAVWETTDGDWKDLNYRAEGFPEILFIPDERVEYEEKQIPSKRINLTTNKMVDYYIQSCEAVFKLQNKEERANYKDLSYLPESELQHIQEIVIIRHNLAEAVKHGLNENSACFCPSHLKIMNCHGKEYLNKIRTVLEE